MSYQVSLLDLPNVTSSPESEFGHTPCDGRDGLTTDQSGQVHVPVNLSARQAKEAGLLTSGTYGQPSTGLSNSVALTSSLVSRLQVITASLGSTLYRLTWKKRVTPSGRRIYALRASAHRTSGKDCSGWGTPKVSTGDYQRDSRGDRILNLSGQAKLATWATPTTRDHKDTGNLETSMVRQNGRERNDTLPRQAFGLTLHGSTAETRNGGQLNPALSRWLMGLPREWDVCGVTAMRSLPQSRKRSLKRT